MSKSYRSEIDGLRSLAVLGVLLYHAEITFYSLTVFPGGFLGVDLFFVISGYLITSLIIKEYQINNKFSFKNFYLRRVYRLLPALLIVIFVSSIFSYFYLLPIRFEDFMKSVLSSLFFFSNFFFHFDGQAYGAQPLTQIPLLHTWSLSLEEQFYLLYPIFIVGISIFAKKRMIAILSLGIISSLIFAIIVNINHQSFNFYMLPSRVWELFFGALLGANINKLSIGKHKKTKEIFGAFGFCIILCSFSLFNDTNNHPTYLTLIPVIGAYLIIQDNNKESLINKFLSIKTLTYLGLISYSLYLWHHPIFSFAKIIGITEKDLLIKLFLIILSIFLASLTYRYIEKPFRGSNKRIINFNKFKVLAGAIILIITLTYTSVDYQKKQYPTITHDLYEKTWLSTKTYFRPCFQRKTFFCSFIENKDNPTIFLVGDSVLASIQEELKNILIEKNFNFIPMTNAGCDFLKNEEMFRSTCNKKLFDNKTKKILETKNSTIILHLNYSTDFKKNVLKDFSKNINSYLDKDYKIILIYPIPQMEESASSEIGKNINNNKLPVSIVNISLAKYLEESKQVFNFFDSMNHKNLYKIYPYKSFCNNYLKDKCIANTQDHIYYIDLLHLSKKGSELISVDLVKIIDNIY